MLTLNCTAALESFGLDSAVGYLHELHPGRDSLSCDLIEEFRAPFVDRFVLTLINRKQVTQKDFESVEWKYTIEGDGEKENINRMGKF